MSYSISSVARSAFTKLGLQHIFKSFFSPNSKQNIPFAWLFTPTMPALRFALCASTAAILAVIIAVWLELDDPAWSAMCVWIVAQGTRGESLSKSRWRIIGTTLGTVMGFTLVSAFYQQPWLFFPFLGLWMAICCTLAVLTRNFRSYALVLAGYTATIISAPAIAHPDNIFFISMSRMTYILLGVVCESVISNLFYPNMASTARRNIRNRLRVVLSDVSENIASLLSGDSEALIRARSMFEPLLAVNNQIEFSVNEMGPRTHEGDHARAALATVAVTLARGLSMATQLKSIQTDQPIFRETSAMISSFLISLRQRLNSDTPIRELLHDLRLVRAECRQQIVNAFSQEVNASSNAEMTVLLDSRILHNSLNEILLELEHALQEYDASQRSTFNDRFRFRIQGHLDNKEAFYNGIRAFTTTICGGLVYECTAWPQGLTFVTYATLVCGLFGTRENPVLVTWQFFVGCLWAALVSFFLTFYALPTQPVYETLAATLAVPFIAGGLAMRNPSTAIQGVAFTLVLPAVLHPINQGRTGEIVWFNSTSATVLGCGFATLCFSLVLPFSNTDERQYMRKIILKDLRNLALDNQTPSMQNWVTKNIDRLSRLTRHAGATPSSTIEQYLQGALATMTIGINVIRLRLLLQRNQLPPTAHQILEMVMYRMSHFTGRYGRTARTAHMAIRTLRNMEANEFNMTKRIELTRAITYLTVISSELDANTAFLNTSQPFKAI
ncbi:MAG: FUSC family protein [Acetobacter sp.]|nr:FUSC family protein [Acetobacter sp.]MBQ5515703.1 FUSC family protein [Acetobacter sp.]